MQIGGLGGLSFAARQICHYLGLSWSSPSSFLFQVLTLLLQISAGYWLDLFLVLILSAIRLLLSCVMLVAIVMLVVLYLVVLLFLCLLNTHLIYPFPLATCGILCLQNLLLSLFFLSC